MAEFSPAAPILRAHDRDRFQTTLFASPSARDALIALYAFDCEVARVRHVVSQPMAGLIRLQWWRDALEGIAGGRPPGQPVARALHASWPLIAPHRPALEATLVAREVELDPAPFATLADLDHHLDHTAAAIGRTAAALLGAPHATEAAGRVLCSWAIVVLLAEVEADRRQARAMLPAELLRRHGVDPVRWADRGPEQLPEEVVRHLVGLARQNLDTARQELPRPGAALPALLLAVPAEAQLRRLERQGFDHRSAWRRTSPMTPLRLIWAHTRRRF